MRPAAGTCARRTTLHAGWHRTRPLRHPSDVRRARRAGCICQNDDERGERGETACGNGGRGSASFAGRRWNARQGRQGRSCARPVSAQNSARRTPRALIPRPRAYCDTRRWSAPPRGGRQRGRCIRVRRLPARLVSIRTGDSVPEIRRPLRTAGGRTALVETPTW